MKSGEKMTPEFRAEIVETACRLGSVNATAKQLGLVRETVTNAIVASGMLVADIKDKRAKETIRYRGPIRCGQRFSPAQGFVWGMKGTVIEMYVEPNSGVGKGRYIATISVDTLRSSTLLIDNPRGTLLVPGLD